MSRQAAPGPPFLPPQPGPGPDLQQRQQQAVEAAALQQAELRSGSAQLAEQHQQRHLVRGDPVPHPEHVRVHDAVRQHRVEVQALVHARHGGARAARPSPGKPRAPAPPANHRPRRRLAPRAAANQRRGCAPPRRGRQGGPGARETFQGQKGSQGWSGLQPGPGRHRDGRAAAGDSRGMGCAWAAAALRSYLLDKGTDIFPLCWHC